MKRFPLREVVPTRTTRSVGSGTTERFNLKDEINKQSLDDIRQTMRDIAAQEINANEKQGNTVSQIIVDNRDANRIDNAQKRIEVFFGVTVPADAMRTVEAALFAAIERSTDPETGKLNSRDAWQWLLIQNGNETRLGGPQDLTSFNQGDRLLLKPTLNYATLVNNVVAGGGDIGYKTKGGGVGMGFLGFAAQATKRNPKFRNLTIYAGFDPQYNVPGELSPRGTGFIAIKAKRTRRFRRL